MLPPISLSESTPAAVGSGARRLSDGNIPGAESAARDEAVYALGYRADIEGLRAVAILLVVAAHAGVPWLAGGYVGVDVFFVLSGYLITGLLLREFSQCGRVNLLEFYARRLRRLLPALMLMLLTVAAAAALLLSPLDQGQQADTAQAASLWLGNVYFALFKLEYFGSEVDSNLFLHTWSLGVEEQFYLVWPLLVLFLLGAWKWQGSGNNTRRLRLGLIAAIVLCLPLCIFVTYALPSWGFYLMPSRAWQFAIGALAVAWPPRDAGASRITGLNLPVAARHLAPVAGWAGLGLIMAAAMSLDGGSRYPGAYALIPSAGAALVLLAGSVAASTGPAVLLSTAPMQAIGRLSYAWYLWHWPVLLLGATVVPEATAARFALVLLSLLLAYVSYRTVERPIRRNAFLAVRPAWTVAAAICVMGIGVGAGSVWKQSAQDWSLTPAQKRFADTRKDLPVLYSMGCDEWFYTARAVACGFGDQQAKHTAVLIGDSIGLQWFPAIAAVYDKPDWRVVVLTKSSCPMVDEAYVYGRIGRRYVECEGWRRKALDAVVALEPDVVFMGSGLSYPFDESQWIDGSRRLLDKMSTAADEVFIIRPTHELGFDGPSCLSGNAWRSPLPSAHEKCSATAGSIAETRVLSWLQRAASAYENVAVLDLNALVCRDGRCDAERDGKIVYRDGSHLTAGFVGSLAGGVAARIDHVRIGREASRRAAMVQAAGG